MYTCIHDTCIHVHLVARSRSCCSAARCTTPVVRDEPIISLSLSIYIYIYIYLCHNILHYTILYDIMTYYIILYYIIYYTIGAEGAAPRPRT